MTDRTSHAKAGNGADPAALLQRATRRARASLIWEGVWPRLVQFATVGGLFMAVAWLGLFLWLPPLGRAAIVAVFVVLAIAALVPLARLRWPDRAAVLARIDRQSGLAHRPATAIADSIAPAQTDPGTRALWQAHRDRMLAQARALRAGPPRPDMPGRDPMALRALVLVLFVATFVAAGGERSKRLSTAFDWRGVVVPANFRVDAWVTPPAYTSRPPVILPGLRAGETFEPGGPVTVPAGSVVVIRATGEVELEATSSSGLERTETDAKVPAGSAEFRFTVRTAGNVTLHGAGDRDLAWAFTALADRPPQIALTKDPETLARGSLQLTYKLEDDYGVAEAQAKFALKPEPDAPPPSRPLYGAPDFVLSLPQARTRNGTGQMIKDLADHPWAGGDVVMTLTARDEGGNLARSEPYQLRLPQRPFVKPLARALIEQRRILALDGAARPRVLAALDALSIAPEKFTPDAGVYLGLRSIAWELTHARSDDALRAVVARLWDMAVGIEDGNLSDVEKALRQAQEKLRQALERGAPDEEIKKLTDELRAALDQYLRQLAEQMRQNPQQAQRPLDPNARTLRSQDLKSMIDRLENLARSGARDAARQLLEELRAMLDNLQTAQPQTGDDDMMSALDELQDLIRKQQQLRDRTFRQGQEQRRQGPQGEPPQSGERDQNQAFSDLRKDQQALRDRLAKMLEELRKHGLPQPGQDQPGQNQPGPGQPGQGDPLGRAGEAMNEAEGDLGERDADGAVESQARALDALRRGAQNLAQSLQRQLGRGPGPGQPGRGPQPRAAQDTDPLGRPLRGRDYDDSSVKVPGEIDAQRARQILEELRKRYGENFRPQLELDYIERLLKGF